MFRAYACVVLYPNKYIDETWKNAPRFLPDDSYERAKIRFWASFFNQQVRKFEPSFKSDSRATTDYYYYYFLFGVQLFEGVGRVVTTDGEAQEKATNDLFEKLKALEGGMKEFFPRGSPTPSINGENMGLLDILMCTLFGPYKIHEEVVGIKMIDPERNPPLSSWLMALTEKPVMKEINPPHEKLFALVHFIRPNALQSSNNASNGVCALC